jgi:hypothetical protein
MKKYIAVIIIGISALGLLFYIFSSGSKQDENIPASGLAERVWPSGMREYRSLLFRFSLFYPDDLKVIEYGEGKGTVITFENTKTRRGFQIFVVPYQEKVITPERFKMDVPSGVIKDKTDILVNGTPATMFYSTNAAMGETREVWFIKNGFLYEVTTYKELDAWLSNIMQTWRFLEF